jgi:hypothetical protein
MVDNIVQMDLFGKRIRVQKGFLTRIKESKNTYSRKASDYEEVFRELMFYNVIKPQQIESPEDFRRIRESVRQDGTKTIHENLVDALEQTFEYKEMMVEKLRYQDIKLKSGKIRKGVRLLESNAWLYIDKHGVLRSRNYNTGWFVTIPDYYGTTPLSEFKQYL